MQIQTFVDQYYNNVSSGSQVSPGVSGMKEVSQSAENVLPGQVFEGSVVSSDDGEASISLPNGQMITARIEGNVNLILGEPVFFEVADNSGGTIRIRQMDTNPSNNPTIQKALDAAGLPDNEKNSVMVDQMIRRGMSIDSDSVASMARSLSAHPEESLTPLMDMKRLGIPDSDANIAQYENYLSDHHEVLSAVDDFAEKLSETISDPKQTGEALQKFAEEFLDFLSSGTEGTSPDSAVSAAIKEPFSGATGDTSPEILPKGGESGTNPEAAVDTAPGKEGAETAASSEETAMRTASGDRLSYVFSGKAESQELSSFFKDFPEFGKAHPEFLQKDGSPDTSRRTGDFLKALLSDVSDGTFPKEKLSRLFSDPAVRGLIRNTLENSVTVTPEQLQREEAPVKELYQRLLQQTDRLDQMARTLTGSNNPVSEAAKNIQDNVSFMSQLNQAMNYVQIPVRLSSQNTNGDLYVYKNPKKHGKGNEDLTAFLHFDLKNLGSTDISVRLRNRSVAVNFYLDSEESANLVSSHIGELEQRLEERGYQCTAAVHEGNEDTKVNFITQVVERNLPPAGTIRRYSFDRKA